MADVAHLGVKITTSTKEFEKGLAGINSSVGQMNDKFSAAGSVIGKAMGVFAGSAIAAGLTNLIKESIRYADVLSNLSARTGVTVGGLQRLESIGVSAGVSMEALASAVTMLHKNLDSPKAIAAIGQMGLNYADIRALGPEKQFIEIAKALAAIDDPIARANAGTALFGRSWSTVAGAFEQDIDSILKNMKEMGDSQVAALDKAGDAWDQFVTNRGRQVKGLLGDMVMLAEAFTINPLNPGGAFEDLKYTSNLPKVAGSGFLKEGGPISPEANFQKVIKEIDAQIAKQQEAAKKLTDALASIQAAQIPLTTAQQTQVLQWQQMGVSAGVMATALGISSEAVQKFLGNAAVMKEVIPSVTLAMADFTALADPLQLQAAATGLANQAIAFGHVREEVAMGAVNFEQFGVAVQEVPPKLTFMQQTFQLLKDSITQNLTAMILGQQSFGQTMSNIWATIKQKVMGHLSDLLHQFVGNFLNGITGAILGQQGATTSAFGGMFGGFSSVLNGMGKMLGGWLSSAAKAIASVFSGGSGAGKAMSGLASAGSSAGGVAGAAGMGGITLATGLATAGIGAAAIGAYVGVKKLIGQSKKKEVNKMSDDFFNKNGGLEGVNQAAEAAGDTDFQTTQAIFNAKDKGQFNDAVKQWEQVTGKKSGGGIWNPVYSGGPDTGGMNLPGKVNWGGEMATGGIVRSPTLAMIGEAGPEAVIPLDKMGGGATYSIVINAVDAKSFEELVERRGVDVFLRAIKLNSKGSRTFLRQALA